ncbi:hypothetical protein L1278_001455 [Pontibacter sp. HSC-36F09]|nr:hypothetical protein [Pontibacter sp. HSC-36F09]
MRGCFEFEKTIKLVISNAVRNMDLQAYTFRFLTAFEMTLKL